MSTDKILDGKRVAAEMLDKAAKKVAKLKANSGVTPCLATVIVGADPGSATYVKIKQQRFEDIGVPSLGIELRANTTTEQLV